MAQHALRVPPQRGDGLLRDMQPRCDQGQVSQLDPHGRQHRELSLDRDGRGRTADAATQAPLPHQQRLQREVQSSARLSHSSPGMGRED